MTLRAACCLAALACAGCVSFPVPPADMGGVRAGQLGRVRLQLTAKWEPDWQGVLQAAARLSLPNALNRPRPLPKPASTK